MEIKKSVLAYSTTGIFVLALIAPQIALAAWWNPFSWNFFTHANQTVSNTQQISTSTPKTMLPLAQATTSIDKAVSKTVPRKPAPVVDKVTTPGGVTCNGKYYTACPNGEQRVCLDDGSNAYCRTPQNNQTIYTPQQIQGVTPASAPTPPPNTTLCNGTYWNKCPSGQDLVCPQSGSVYCQLNVAAVAQQQQDQAVQSPTNMAAQQAAQDKQNKLDSINQQIAALNAKYATDVLNVTNGLSGGVTQSQINGMKQTLYTKYIENYNILMAQWQQIKYSN